MGASSSAAEFLQELLGTPTVDDHKETAKDSAGRAVSTLAMLLRLHGQGLTELEGGETPDPYVEEPPLTGENALLTAEEIAIVSSARDAMRAALRRSYPEDYVRKTTQE